MEFLLAFQGALAQGLLWSILALGTYITFRLLSFPDMTIDGAFAAGGCAAAMAIAAGVPPLVAMLFAALIGAVAGAVTGFFHSKLGIPEILAGILTQISLYSINLRLLGRANQPLLKLDTVFRQVQRAGEALGLSLSLDQAGLLVGVLLVGIVVVVLYWFFGTEIGAAIRATGDNEAMVRALGQNTHSVKVLALMISNAVIGFAGSLVAMYQGAGDVGMGTGAIVIGLASIVIGEVLFPRVRPFWAKMLAVVIGSLVYRVIVALVLQLGLNTNDLKLLTAVLVAAALYLPQAASRRQARKYAGAVEREDRHA